MSKPVLKAMPQKGTTVAENTGEYGEEEDKTGDEE